MNRFEYTRAVSVEQAIAQLKDPDVVVKAGGVDLLDRMKEGLIAPRRVVDLSSLGGLHYLRDEQAGLRIGALATLAEIAAHPAVRARFAALADACGHAATPQVRNVATLGGNLVQRPRCWYFRSADFHCRKKGGATCFAQEGENQFHAIVGNHTCAAVCASTPATALVAFGARVKLAGPGGERELALEEFFTAPEKSVMVENALAPDELVTEVIVPSTSARSAYLKQGEKESFDWPIADVAAVLELDGRTCKRASIVLGSAAPVPLRAKEAEAALAGRAVDERSADAAARAALAGATPLGKNAYKVPVFQAVIRRTILAAVGSVP